MGLIDFDRYYKILGNESITYQGGCLPELVNLGIDTLKCFSECKKILDVGTGNGFWAEWLRKRNFNVSETDLNKLHDLVIECDMHNLTEEFDRWQFDGVFLNGVFEHSLSPFILMCEINKILKLNGKVFLNYPASYNKKMTDLPQHIGCYDDLSMKNVFKKTGFNCSSFLIDTSEGPHYVFILTKVGEIE